MGADKPEEIPLAAALKGKGGKRNLLALMGEKHSDPKLRVALTKELLAARGRRGGKDRDDAQRARQHIRTLLEAHPNLTAKPAKLWEHANKSIVGYLDKKRWANLVGEVRKNL